MNSKSDSLHPALAAARSLALAFLLVPVASVTASAQEYYLIDLGRNVSPQDINDAGAIVGSMNTDQYPTTAFIRDPAEGVNREICGGMLGTVATAANAINDAQDPQNSVVAGNTLTGAFLCRADGSTIPQQWDDRGAWGINSNGDLSGNSAGTNPYRTTPIPYDPAIYVEGKGWIVMDIANVYPRGTRQGVYADNYRLLGINDSGLSVGSKSRYGLSGSSAILIAPVVPADYSNVNDAGDVIYLPTPYGGSAAAINNQNMIAGTTGNDSYSGTFAHAFLYDYDNDILTDLGTLLNADGEYGLRSSAADINDKNQVVGSSSLVSVNTSLYDPAQYHAFLWEGMGMQDLNDLIDPSTGWILTASTAINENGAIVGTGILNGEPHGFLLSATQPPSPPPPGENQPPQAVAVADVTLGKAPLTVTFSAADSSDPEGTALSYVWDFGDPNSGDLNSASGVAPVHEYRDPGIYLVFLTVTDEAGAGLSDTAQLEITVRRGNGKK